jgi:hydroxyethylthiazole kinase
LTYETWRWGDQPVTDGLRAVSERAPLVHCLTNIVVAGFTANVLLAVGASPAMVENAEESAAFAAIAGGVLVNLGTLSAEREQAMSAAAASAADAGVPWVLDPVAVGALAHRTTFAVGLLAHAPKVVRGNPSEILSLAAAAGAVDSAAARGGRGVDSLAASTEALDAAGALAKAHGCVVAVSGATDYVTDGATVVEIPGGHPLMTRVTGVGCALGALMAAMAAVNNGDGLASAAGASAVFAAAGERAAVETDRPGSFAVALIDHLADLATG